MKKLNFAFVCVVLALGANAEPTLTDVKAQTHYPWDGKVDLSYTTQGVRDEMIARGLELSLRVLAIDETTHMTNTATPAALSGDMTFADGTHAFVWDMDKQGLKEINSSNVVFKVTCMAADGDSYNDLSDKPSINGTTLDGNKTTSDLGITGTTVMLNGESKAGAGATIFAPTTGGTAGQILVSGGANAAPSWSGFTKVSGTMESGVGGGVSAYKCGKLCFVYIGGVTISGESGKTATKVIATLPVGYRSSEFICAAVMTNYGGNPSLVSISGNSLKLWGAGTNVGYYGSFFYYTYD